MHMDIKMDKDMDMGLVTEEVAMFMDKRKHIGHRFTNISRSRHFFKDSVAGYQISAQIII
jgi:hypothetical protein